MQKPSCYYPAIILAMAITILPSAAPAHSVPRDQASVDVAILLDTSNAMDGLINQAKSQLWTIVQQFARAQKNNDTPLLRVALFEYGNTNLPAREGYLSDLQGIVILQQQP